jgi:hypothetical protein
VSGRAPRVRGRTPRTRRRRSQQAKQSTRAVIEARTVDVEGDGYLAA